MESVSSEVIWSNPNSPLRLLPQNLRDKVTIFCCWKYIQQRLKLNVTHAHLI